MPGFMKKKKQRKVRHRSAIPPSLWLFYLGLISMSLTGVTFSRYSTVVQGTISVIVADSYQVTFFDDTGEEMSSCRVYEGQQLHETDIPEGSDSILTEDGNPVVMELGTDSEADMGLETVIYKKFLGWSLDGETIVEPAKITVDGELCFYAVYEHIEKIIEKATPSNAVETAPMPQPQTPAQTQPPETKPDSGPATVTVPETVPEAMPEINGEIGNETVSETPGTGGGETAESGGGVEAEEDSKEPVIIASSSNAIRE